ncbi:hypothetical protein HMPREF9151_02008 [Hoylesella saccharolytica F0055]|uniref:Uncharacterized protein n=1 Tax=Hoylesella saccharolytica F0055 TaxID=1127699 RepID=L1N514_9BACT|nr:hypothetical protein HMPREF9151_02008 [Hoylesella saccharolytica F0055]
MVCLPCGYRQAVNDRRIKTNTNICTLLYIDYYLFLSRKKVDKFINR